MKYYIYDLSTETVNYVDKKEFYKSLRYNLSVAYEYGEIQGYEEKLIRLQFVDAVTKKYSFSKIVNDFEYGVEI